MNSVDHPAHYVDGGYECIEVMKSIFGENEVKIFCKLNAFKYLWRCNHKHTDPGEDIEKAEMKNLRKSLFRIVRI